MRRLNELSFDDADALRQMLRRQLGPLAAVFVLAVVVFSQIGQVDMSTILQKVSVIPAQAWALSAMAAAVSFWAFGRFETVLHQILRTGHSSTTAHLSGMAAVAISQLLGFGLLTGTLARWRLLPQTSLRTAASITVMASLSFMAALAVLGAVTTLLVHPGPGYLTIGAVGVIAVTLICVLCTLWRPKVLWPIPLPSLRAQSHLVGLTMLDTLAACFALYVLLPTGLDTAFPAFYAAFLLALAAGLLGTTPGGVGPFEFMIVALLSTGADPDVFAALFGYRIIYFAAPAILAALALIAAPKSRAQNHSEHSITLPSEHFHHPMPALALSYNARIAEAGLLRQGLFDLLTAPSGPPLAMVARTAQSLILLREPLPSNAVNKHVISVLQHAANTNLLIPCLYKANARLALAARQLGWNVVKTGEEAAIDPTRFHLDTSALRQLRRALRKAQSAGVTAQPAFSQLPMAQMRDVHRDWARKIPEARGFSMGQFDDSYVAVQRVYLARQADKLIGFASFHECWRERALDLLCVRPDAPAGTAHTLIHAAIQSAQADRMPRLSLAAVPTLDRHLPNRWQNKAATAMGAPGLRRFKASFAPTWSPLYMAAPGPMSTTIAGIDLIDNITRPRNPNRIHNLYSDYEFE